MAKKKNVRRADGRYAVQVYIGRVDGKRKYKTVYGTTQKEADEKALQIKLSMRKGIDITHETDNFSLWADRYLDLKKAEVANGQYVAINSFCKHLCGYIGNDPITKIKPHDLQEIFLELASYNPNTGNPASQRFLNGLRDTARGIFRLAVNNRVLDYNPIEGLIMPKAAPAQHRRALTDEEQQWIISTPHRAQLAAMIMMFAGLRRGELLALTWSDIDLDKATIHVNKAVEFINGKPLVKHHTKTAAGMRIIDIPEILVKFLRSQPRKNLLVCTSVQGTMMSTSAWNRMWESYLCELNVRHGGFQEDVSKYAPYKIPFVIPHITAHWLRHTFASTLYMAEVDVLTAKEQLGHTDAKTTMDIYTHLNAQFKRKSMAKVNTYLKGKQLG